MHLKIYKVLRPHQLKDREPQALGRRQAGCLRFGRCSAGGEGGAVGGPTELFLMPEIPIDASWPRPGRLPPECLISQGAPVCPQVPGK